MPNLGLIREFIAWLLVVLVLVERVITMVATRRRAAAAFLASHPNGHPTLLTLPLELRLEILQLVLSERSTCKYSGVLYLDGSTNAWLPPPILQTCRRLRLDGMIPLLSLPIHFKISNLHAARLINYHAWLALMRSYYPDEKDALFGPNRKARIWLPEISDRSAASNNLWQWLHAFYKEAAPGYFLASDRARRPQPRHPIKAFVTSKDKPDVPLQIL